MKCVRPLNAAIWVVRTIFECDILTVAIDIIAVFLMQHGQGSVMCYEEYFPFQKNFWGLGLKYEFR